MRTNLKTQLIFATIIFIFTTAFQCSSPEMTSAKLYLQRKDTKKAAEQLQLEISKNPKNAEAYYLLGQIKYENQDYKGMKDAFTGSLAAGNVHEKEIKNFTMSAWAKNFNEGVEVLNNAIDDTTIDRSILSFEMAYYLLPESTMNVRNLGLAHYRRGNISEALSYLQKTFEKEKDDLSIRIIGRVYTDAASKLKNKYFEENSEILEKAKNLNSVQVRMKSEDLKYLIGQPTSTVVKDKKSKREEWAYDAYSTKFIIENGLVAAINKSIELTPDTTLLAQSKQEFAKAVEILKVGISLYPEDSEISEMLMNAYIGSEKNIEARLLLEERVVKFPDSKYDHYNLGVYYLKDNDYPSSIKHFEAAIKIDSSFSAAVYNLAASYVNWGVAEQERLKKIKKDDDKSYNEKFKIALPYLERIIQEKPDDVQMLELLAQVYANLGNSKKAEEFYKKADSIRSGKK